MIIFWNPKFWKIIWLKTFMVLEEVAFLMGQIRWTLKTSRIMERISSYVGVPTKSMWSFSIGWFGTTEDKYCNLFLRIALLTAYIKQPFNLSKNISAQGQPVKEFSCFKFSLGVHLRMSYGKKRSLNLLKVYDG